METLIRVTIFLWLLLVQMKIHKECGENKRVYSSVLITVIVTILGYRLHWTLLATLGAAVVTIHTDYLYWTISDWITYPLLVICVMTGDYFAVGVALFMIYTIVGHRFPKAIGGGDIKLLRTLAFLFPFQLMLNMVTLMSFLALGQFAWMHYVQKKEIRNIPIKFGIHIGIVLALATYFI